MDQLQHCAIIAQSLMSQQFSNQPGMTATSPVRGQHHYFNPYGSLENSPIKHPISPHNQFSPGQFSPNHMTGHMNATSPARHNAMGNTISPSRGQMVNSGHHNLMHSPMSPASPDQFISPLKQETFLDNNPGYYTGKTYFYYKNYNFTPV